jgi:hypothetical protein
MMSGDPVQWIAEGGTLRVGVYVRPLPSGDMPALPAGVGRHRRRFRPSPSRSARVLVRDVTTWLYYAPRADSLEATKEGCDE